MTDSDGDHSSLPHRETSVLNIWRHGVCTYLRRYIYREGQKLNQNAHTSNFMSEVAEHNP